VTGVQTCALPIFMNLHSADSLDGRYFGPISSSAVIARAQPVWIEKE